MLIKEFIDLLQTLPQDSELNFGNINYKSNLNTGEYDMECYDIEQSGGSSADKITIWCEE